MSLGIDQGPSDAGSVLLVGVFPPKGRHYAAVGEQIAARLRARGWKVHLTSRAAGRMARPLSMAKAVVLSRGKFQVAVVDLFSGPAFFWGLLTCTLLMRLRKPYVLALRGGNLPVFSERYGRLVEFVLRNAATVTCPSPYLLRRLQRFSRSMMLLPNGIDIGQYPFRPRAEARPDFVWLRAFHRIYHPQMAPRVIGRVLPDFSAARLTMIGPDKGDHSLQETRNAAIECGCKDRVLFPGAVPKAEVPRWLEKSDIFLNTTSIDNTPVSVMEAMACGLCIVSTDAGGIPDLLRNGEEALLVPVGDERAMERAVRRILTEPELAERLSRNARQSAERLDWSNVIPMWERVLTAARTKTCTRTQPEKVGRAEQQAGNVVAA